MAEAKTRPTDVSPTAFLQKVPDEERRQDCFALLQIMQELTGSEPRMWGPGIVGFGSYRYRYASGREGDWMLIGFSPRKKDLTLYIMGGFEGHEALLAKLGKHKTGKSCLYIKRLADIDLSVLKSVIVASVRYMKKTYPQA